MTATAATAVAALVMTGGDCCITVWHMDMQQTLRWPVAPQQVVRARCDAGYLEALCRRTGAVEHDVQVDGLRTVVRRVMPTDRFPDFARKMTGDRITMVETTTWQPEADADSARHGEVRLTVEGAPVQATFATVVRPDGTGAVEVVSGEVTAKVPLIGGRIEKAVLPGLQAAMDAQVDTYRVWAGQGD